MKNENIIKIENLIFRYAAEEGREAFNAVDGVSLEIEKGSFTAILGKNGSGKSTLAKNLNGLLLPTEGAVYVGGFDTRAEEHVWDVRQTAGMVFQNPDNQLVSAIVEDDVACNCESMRSSEGSDCNKHNSSFGIINKCLFMLFSDIRCHRTCITTQFEPPTDVGI